MGGYLSIREGIIIKINRDYTLYLVVTLNSQEIKFKKNILDFEHYSTSVGFFFNNGH